jgi:YD repeat-containing protein
MGISAPDDGKPARVWSYTYNVLGQLRKIDGPRQPAPTDVDDVTTFTYNASGDLATITNALSQITQFTSYDAVGRVTEIIDPNGLETHLEYWPRGWLKSRELVKTSASESIHEKTQYDYDSVGQLTKVTQPDNSYIQFTYDDAHRLITINDSLGNAIDYALDNMGNRLEEDTSDSSHTLIKKVRRDFDILNRLSTEIDTVSNATTTIDYDQTGNPLHITPPASLVRSRIVNAYDALSRITQTTDSSSAVVKYEYDGLDQLTKVTDPRNLETTYAVNGLGNQQSLTSPDTGFTTFSAYDDAGNLKTATDARGKVVN